MTTNAQAYVGHPKWALRGMIFFDSDIIVSFSILTLDLAT